MARTTERASVADQGRLPFRLPFRRLDALRGRLVARSTVAALTVRLTRAVAEGAAEPRCSAWVLPAVTREVV